MSAIELNYQSLEEFKIDPQAEDLGFAPDESTAPEQAEVATEYDVATDADDEQGVSLAKKAALTGFAVATAATATILGAGPTSASAAEQAPSATLHNETVATAAVQPPQPAAAPAEKVVGFVAADQPNEVYCGPAATRNAVTTAGKFPTHEELAQKEHTTQDGTESVENVTPVLEEYTGKNYTSVTIPGHTANPQTEAQVSTHVKTAINDNKAVVANVKGTETDLSGVKHSYEGGHYVTVVGYGQDGKTVKIADPYANEATPGHSPDGTIWLSSKDFTNWVAQRGYSA